MPGIDGLLLLKQFRANPKTRGIPVIVLSGKEQPLVKAQAFALGASDYIVKLPDRVELIARIRHHSQRYIAQMETDKAHRNLAEKERHLSTDVAQAALHVQSLLPAPIEEGPIRTHWRFVPSTQLGGDAFGYQWLDPQHFAFYLLDVSGHGFGASLLAVSVLNTLSHRTLLHTDFRDPAAVLRSLNKVFRMEKHGRRFFTIWYGVAAVDEGKLTYSGGGHLPALFFSRQTSSGLSPEQLLASGPPIGVIDEASFDNTSIPITQGSRLLLYSDGAVEIRKTGGGNLDLAEFIEFAAEAGHREDLLDQALDRCRQMRNGMPLLDDCSLMQIDFV